MALIVGIDEAGYGPNLGPLVVGASAWITPTKDDTHDLYETLGGSICQRVADAENGERLPIADSKELYSPGGSLALLEQSVIATAELTGTNVSSWRKMKRSLQVSAAQETVQPVWERDFDLPLPMNCAKEQLAQVKTLMSDACNNANVQPLRVAASIIQPQQFNEQTEAFGNKAALLSRTSLILAKSIMAASDQPNVQIYCDKHGGRKRYAGFLQDVFETGLISVVGETAAESVYRFSSGSREIVIRFTAKGESQLPVALASMTAKYCREISMKAFNAFWSQHVPGIRPTAGYPQDAKRFRAEIATAQQKLGVTNAELWRER